MSSPVYEPHVLVSWSGSELFAGPYDDVTAYVAGVPGFTVDEGRDAAATLAGPKVQAGSFELFNQTGRFSQERPDSPVYQRVVPGRPVQYQLRSGTPGPYDAPAPYDAPDAYDGVGTFPLGHHVIDSLSQRTAIGDQRVGITTIGIEAVLTKTTVSINLQVAPRVDQCVSLLLYAAGWPSDKRQIAISDTTLLYWWCDERRPWDALLELLASEGPGCVYVDRAGVFHWENRNFRTTEPRADVSQATFSDIADGPLWYTSLQYEPGFKSIYNRATYATKLRALGPLAAVWTYGDDIDLLDGQTRTLIAKPPDPFENAILPVLGTDYTKTGAGTVSILINATSGLTVYITISAIGGAATVSGLQLRAQPLTVIGETIVQNPTQQSASIAKYSTVPGANIPNTLDVAGWPEIDTVMAEAVCDAWVNRYHEARPTVTIGVEHADVLHREQLMRRMPSDRITVRAGASGLVTSDVWINAMTTTVGLGGRLASVWACERCEEVAGNLWDDATTTWDDANTKWGT